MDLGTVKGQLEQDVSTNIDPFCNDSKPSVDADVAVQASPPAAV